MIGDRKGYVESRLLKHAVSNVYLVEVSHLYLLIWNDCFRNCKMFARELIRNYYFLYRDMGLFCLVVVTISPVKGMQTYPN